MSRSLLIPGTKQFLARSILGSHQRQFIARQLFRSVYSQPTPHPDVPDGVGTSFTRSSVDWISLALQKCGRYDIVPQKFAKKLNLSLESDAAEILGRARWFGDDADESHKVTRRSSFVSPASIPDPRHSNEPSVQRILAASIIRISGRSKDSTEPAMSLSDQRFLSKRGHSPSHLEGWARVLLTADPETAFSAFRNLRQNDGSRAAPLFVLLYLLRRPKLDRRALDIALQEAQALVAMEHEYHGWRPATSFFILFIRLLRHVRTTWPAAILASTDLLVSCLSRDLSFAQDHISQITDRANRALELISWPLGVEPLANTSYQETALIKVLEFMENNGLNIHRSGYRAVVRVQLAQPKTPRDRRWAQLKILSWPPWKEDKTQVDAEITQETHGVSRAMNTLMQMEAAGYAPYLWERAARLYAGWDSDGTPTIQRRFLPGFKSYSSMVWEARIWTTRSAQEAWAAYLAWESSAYKRESSVYEAIFQRLLEERHRLGKTPRYLVSADGEHRDANVLPGDKREISPPPPSTHLWTHTRTSPPSPHRLYQRLHQQRVKLSPRCIAVLLRAAPNLEFGLGYIKQEGPKFREVLSCDRIADFTDWTKPHTHGFRQLLTAYIEMLLRFAVASLPETMLELESRDRPLMLFGERVVNPTAFVGALQLFLHWRDAPEDETWLALTQSLRTQRTARGIRRTYGLSGNDAIFRSGHMVVKIYHELFGKRSLPSIDAQLLSLNDLCKAHIMVSFQAWETLAASPGSRHAGEVAFLSGSGPKLDLKAVFWRTVNEGMRDDVQAFMFSVPSPALLSSYTRAQGLKGDHSELLELLRWCVEHQDGLSHQAARDVNGQILLERWMVGIRVFLERAFLPSVPDMRDVEGPSDEEKILRTLEQPASPELLAEARELMEQLRGWGGWPSDDAVEDYVAVTETKNKLFSDLRKAYAKGRARNPS